MVRRIFLLALLCLLSAPAAAQRAEPSGALDWLLGSWKGGGTHSGRRSEARLQARPALGGRFVELTYRLKVGAPKPFAFEGRAFYRPVDGGGWKADWFDSRGLVLPVSASVEGSSLTADWGTIGTEQGRTIYRLLADGRLEVVDAVVGPDGARREFARQLFRRER